MSQVWKRLNTEQKSMIFAHPTDLENYLGGSGTSPKTTPLIFPETDIYVMAVDASKKV